MKSNEDSSTAFLTAARNAMNGAMHKIQHCCAQLSDDQLWWRPRPEMNSIANLMLHLSGNIRQWIISGVGGAPDIRNRPKEFSDQSKRSKAQVLAILKGTINEADAVLAKVSAAQLVSLKRIQGHDTDVTSAIFKTIAHLVGHSQEIIHMTRQQLGDSYKFDFVPKGKEQESATGPGI